MMKFEIFPAVKNQVWIFRSVTPCSVVVQYQCFREPYCLHLQGEVTYNQCQFFPSPVTSSWRRRQHGLLQRWHPSTSLHGVTIQKTSTRIQSCLVPLQ